jgi:hypothetical protein
MLKLFIENERIGMTAFRIKKIITLLVKTFPFAQSKMAP